MPIRETAFEIFIEFRPQQLYPRPSNDKNSAFVSNACRKDPSKMEG